MRSVILVGCGQVVRERILPAIRALSTEDLLAISHVVDTLPADRITAALELLPPPRPVYHRVGSEEGALSRLLSRDDWGPLPLLVATPTPRHAEHACAALAAGRTVGLEKPLAASAVDLDAIHRCLARTDGRLLFPFGYYLIEKGLPLLALARRGALSATQLGCLEGISAGEWAELRERLGEVLTFTGVIREGPDRRQWVLSDEAGGHTLETFSHLVAMALPWFGSVTVNEALLGRTALAPSGAENVVWAALTGPDRRAIRLGCEKWCGPGAAARWIAIAFERGTARMDLEAQILTVESGGRRWVARVAARAKYEPQLRMFAAKLDDPREPSEYEIGRQSALISIAIRAEGLRRGLRLVERTWLDERLEESTNG